MSGKYDDIIGMEHHVSKKHPRMSMNARAAQFAPFAALVGYGDAIGETARQTERPIEPDEMQIEMIDAKLRILLEKVSERPTATFVFFVRDISKSGGSYESVTGTLTAIDPLEGTVVLRAENGAEIRLRPENILSVESGIFTDP